MKSRMFRSDRSNVAHPASLARSLFSSFAEDSSGSAAIFLGLAAVALVGAVGLGVDTYRVQNTQAGLQRVADAICREISNASSVNYRSSTDVVAMATRYATGELNSNSATSGASVSLNDDGSSYSVALSKFVKSTLGAVVGYKGSNLSLQNQCSKMTATPYKCLKSSYIYASNNVAGQTLSKSSLSSLSQSATPSQFVVTFASLDSSNKTNVLNKTVINSDYVIPATTAAATTVFVQDVNNDGSLPQFCEDALPYTAPTPPSGDSGSSTYCSASPYLRTTRTETMSNSKYDQTVALSPSPSSIPSTFTLTTSVLNGASAGPYTVKFNVSKGFAASGSTVSITGVSGLKFTTSVEQAYLFSVAAGKFGSMMTDVVGAGWKLVYVKSHTDAVWEDLKGGCNDISSPLAVDLIGLGRIETTGVSTAVDAIRPKVGRTIVLQTRDGPTKIEWLTGNGQGFLVDDRDGRAETDMSDRRLFGPTDSTSDGFETLAKLDHSGTGVLSGRDLEGLAVWIDNGDGIVQHDEITPLSKLGITAIDTRWSAVFDEAGHMKMQSHAIRDGKRILVEDIWLATDMTRTAAQDDQR